MDKAMNSLSALYTQKQYAGFLLGHLTRCLTLILTPTVNTLPGAIQVLTSAILKSKDNSETQKVVLICLTVGLCLSLYIGALSSVLTAYLSSKP